MPGRGASDHTAKRFQQWSAFFSWVTDMPSLIILVKSHGNGNKVLIKVTAVAELTFKWFSKITAASHWCEFLILTFILIHTFRTVVINEVLIWLFWISKAFVRCHTLFVYVAEQVTALFVAPFCSERKGESCNEQRGLWLTICQLGWGLPESSGLPGRKDGIYNILVLVTRQLKLTLLSCLIQEV